MDKFKRILVVVAAVGMASSTLAADKLIFRYRDAILGNAGAVTGPEAPDSPAEAVPFICPDADGLFSSEGVSQVPNGCFYPAPLVDLVSDPGLQVSYERPTLDGWCGGVFPGSHATKAVEGVQKTKAADYVQLWSAKASATVATGIVCTDDPGLPHVQPVPEVRTGTLKNADMERWSGIAIESWNGYASSRQAADPDIGGSKTLSPYGFSEASKYSQDVAVDSALSTKAFPVSVEWLQTNVQKGSYTAAVHLKYLDAAKAEIGSTMSSQAAPDRARVQLQRVISGTAPAGTAFIRVTVDFAAGSAVVDNVALKIDGTDVSEINGGYGMPIRPQDYVKNAGAESASANWTAMDSPLYTLAADHLDDPHKLQGAKSFNTSPYGDQTHFQQVWISSSEKGKPITLQWQQATSTTAPFPTMVSVNFFTRSGEALGSIKGDEVPGIPGFWQNRKLTGVVPSDADFMLVEMYFKSTSHWVDNIGINIGATEFAEVTSGKPSSMNLCPSYVNTINGPADNPWWYDGSLAKKPYVRLDPQADGWTGEQYKSYCVAPGGRFLLGNYTLQAYRAWGGFKYEAFDGTGRKIGEQTLLHDVEKWETPEEIWELYALPKGTSFVKTTLVDLAKAYTNGAGDDYGANFTRRITATKVNFIMNGGLPPVPAERSILRNAGAEAGTKFWTPAPYTGGVLTRKNKETVGNASSTTSGGGGSTSTSSVSCDDMCLVTPKDYAFYSNLANGEFYQDVIVAGYKFEAGSDVKLEWEIGMGGGVSSTSKTSSGGTSTSTNTIDMTYNPSEMTAGMGLEFYDVDGNLVGTKTSELSFPLFLFWEIELKKSMSFALPANTWKVRVIMKGLRNNRAAIDNIELKIAGKKLYRED